jgi:hypothetical protein
VGCGGGFGGPPEGGGGGGPFFTPRTSAVSPLGCVVGVATVCALALGSSAGVSADGAHDAMNDVKIAAMIKNKHRSSVARIMRFSHRTVTPLHCALSTSL